MPDDAGHCHFWIAASVQIAQRQGRSMFTRMTTLSLLELLEELEIDQ